MYGVTSHDLASASLHVDNDGLSHRHTYNPPARSDLFRSAAFQTQNQNPMWPAWVRPRPGVMMQGPPARVAVPRGTGGWPCPSGPGRAHQLVAAQTTQCRRRSRASCPPHPSAASCHGSWWPTVSSRTRSVGRADQEAEAAHVYKVVRTRSCVFVIVCDCILR